MIGTRIDIQSSYFDYVWGLLMDEGLVPEDDFMAAGGATVIIRRDAWGLLTDRAQREVARFMRSVPEVVVTPAEDNVEPDSDVTDTQPAGEGDSGSASPAAGARSRARRPVKSATSEGAH